MKNINNKKIILWAGLILITILLIAGLTVLTKDKATYTKNEQERLSNYIEKKSKNFYENIYYPQLSDIVDEVDTFLQNFEEEGIPLSINVLIEQNVITEEEAQKEMKNKDNNTQCDFNNTKAVIYPKNPYKKDSYKLEIRLDCNLENTEQSN